MDVEIRPCASVEEVRQAVTPIGSYFGRLVPNENQVERLIRVLPAGRVYGAWEGDRAVGGSSRPDRPRLSPGRVLVDDESVFGMVIE
jgi:hypothetical protein